MANTQVSTSSVGSAPEPSDLMATSASDGAMVLQTRQLMQYDANKKSVLVAYLLWFFLGGLGAHRFYLGRTGTGLSLLLLTGTGLLMSVVFIGFFILIIPAIWILVDLFLIPGMVRQSNNSLIGSLS